MDLCRYPQNKYCVYNDGPLGPIDPVVRHPHYPDTWISVQALHYSYDFICESIDQYTPKQSRQYINLFEKIDPWLLGDYFKMIKASKQYAELLLSEFMFKGQNKNVESIVDKLINGYYSHGYPINKDEAKILGLSIADVPQEVTDIILELYLEYERLLNISM